MERIRHNEKTIIAVEGVPFILIAAFLSLIAYFTGFTIVAIILGIITIFIIWFFRNPERAVPKGRGLIVAPADGKIIEIKEVEERRYLKEKCLKVSIFMNIFDVHVNRAPYPGTITGVFYNKGKFMAADKEMASLANEHNAVLLSTPEGKKILFIQIAGLIARRIACWVKRGDEVERGQRFGLIRFGSRVDIYLPLGVKLRVFVGNKTIAGVTILGVIE